MGILRQLAIWVLWALTALLAVPFVILIVVAGYAGAAMALMALVLIGTLWLIYRAMFWMTASAGSLQRSAQLRILARHAKR